MEAQHVQSDATVTITAPTNVANGQVLNYGSSGVAIAQAPQTTGRPVGCAIKGVYEFNKAPAGVSYAAGDLVGWDTASRLARAFTAGASRYLGICHEDAASGDSTIRVRINEVATPAVP